MLISHASALAEYQKSRAALMDVINDLDATEAQASKAEAAALKLNSDFIQAVISTIEQRSVQFKQFVAYMQNVVAELKEGGPLQVLTGVEQALASAVATDQTQNS